MCKEAVIIIQAGKLVYLEHQVGSPGGFNSWS
jgi:hypothetical protein